jgi:long-chain acyl-CoA synthetase
MTSLISPLRRAVQVGADRPSITCGDEQFTYRQTWERCRRLVAGLRSLGLRSGDRVAVIGPNCHRYLELYIAVPGAGMVIVPLNARHTDVELQYALEDSGAKIVFSARDLGVIASSIEVVDFADGYEALLASQDPVDIPDQDLDSTLAGLFYTGGTTGASKGVMLTHRNLIANAFHFSACWPFSPETTGLIAAPLFHAAGSVAVIATVWNAGHHVILRSFDAGRALDLIEQHRVTSTLVVPTMLAAMTDEQLRQPRDISTLHFLAHGGSPCAVETLRRAHHAFPNAQLLHVYGATETAPIATLLPHEERMLDTDRARSCGQSAIGVEVTVVDGDGNLVPAGVVGEVVVRGPNVMAGYWNKPVETAAALVDGAYRTGDLGSMDDEGFLFLVDRAKDMIVTGGENVYSTEVEEALYVHPAVLEAAVYGIPDPRWGEAVAATVVPRWPVAEDELIHHCRRLIAGYKLPRRIEIQSEPLPKSGAGKILKRELRARFWSDDVVRVGGA